MKFVVYGKPQGKGRPRFRRTGNFISTYTPKETSDYEEKIKQAYLSTNGKIKLNGALKMKIEAYFEPPKSLSKKKKEALLGTYHVKKSDSDNIAKIVCDGLNKVAYEDDSSISILVVEKKYDETERVEVEIENI